MSNSTGSVLVTGASSGFGEAIARKFAENNFKLIITARREERLATLASELEKDAAVHYAKLDVCNVDEVQRVLEDLPEEFREIDILVNNAGLALGLSKAQEADLSEWERMIDTNIKGLIYCTRAILPGMVERNHGHIINIGSISGRWPYAGANVYGATKSFVAQFSRNLRADLLGTNVRVTNVEPGLAETEFSIVRFSGDKDKASEVYKGTEPLKAQDVAEVCYWVASAPEHVNINSIEVMPTCQGWTALEVARRG